MLTMNNFHSMLFENRQHKGEYFTRLLQVTQLSLNRLKAIQNLLSWDIWS